MRAFAVIRAKQTCGTTRRKGSGSVRARSKSRKQKNAEPELTVQARPEPRAKKSEWQAYAATLGLDPSGMTTEQIVAMVDAFEADGQE